MIDYEQWALDLVGTVGRVQVEEPNDSMFVMSVKGELMLVSLPLRGGQEGERTPTFAIEYGQTFDDEHAHYVYFVTEHISNIGVSTLIRAGEQRSVEQIDTIHLEMNTK